MAGSTTDLGDLRWHWGAAYEIDYRAGQYRAIRRDDGSMVRTDTAEQMLAELRADYATRPVSRDVRGGQLCPWPLRSPVSAGRPFS